MIKFYDSGGTVHFGQATITRTTSVNGGLSLTGEVFAGGDVLNGLDYGWWLNFDNEKYVITYKKLSDDTNTVVFDAVQQFFWDFAKVALHAQYTGSHEYTFYLGQLFDKSGYTYKNDVTVPAFEKENWGYKNKLDLFNDIMDQAGVEFEVHNETVHIAKQIGSDLTSFVRKGINLSNLTEEMKISDFATYAKGYGAFKDAEDQSKGRLEVEYRSELAKKFGDLEMDPIVDERYTVADNLIAALKKQVDATYTVSMTMNIYDLENAGYPNYEAPKVGDWILAIDEALNFKRKIRIIQLEEQFDVTGKRIGYTATCGDLSIVDQYTHLQSSLDSRVQRIQKSVDDVAISANGKSSNYYGAKEPIGANEGDLWFDQSNSDPDKWSIKQWVNGRWEQITLNHGEIDAKVDVAKQEAETAVENAKSASDKADQLASKYDDTNSLAHQALDRSVSAQSDANSAVAAANSTASEFGKVDQKAGSALASALNAQSDASDAVKQASSAAADSKDAKQIAGAVSQSYKTLTNGSTMTIAELENGLATKLTKTDLDGYATQTWTQNQINVTADGINGTMSSIKNTVDGQTTDINDLKADSSSFKSQFTTVNNTLGKQSTDIGTLQATSKELTSGFNTLTSDNTTNKNDISQLKQTATEVSSTLETVQTQVQNSAVGTNLLTGTGSHTITGSRADDYLSNETTDDLLTLFKGLEGQTVTVSVDYEYSGFIAGSGYNRLGWEAKIVADTTTYVGPWYYPNNDSGSGIISSTFVVPKNITGVTYSTGYIQFPGSGTGTLSHLKLEKGSLATDWCPNPADNATVTAFSQLSQTVDGMKSDISKKIEQKDLNGYATQTWSQNQITSTANGINATVSSVKTTVDGHTTSINDLKADSSSFKSQFTTVNNTLGKQSTDIGTLQATSKELTSGFNTLTSDNTTNKNDISQLKQTATEVSSTLETVQTQVQNSAVGTNLLTGTADKILTGTFTGGFVANETNDDMLTLFKRLEGQTVTVSVDYEYSGFVAGSAKNRIGWEVKLFTDSNPYYFGPWYNIPSTNSSGSGRISSTFVVPENITSVESANGYIQFSGSGTGTVSHLKLEKGSLATDWCPNPADNATVTAVSSISQTIDSIQTTVRGKVDNDTYQTDIKQLSGQITSVAKKADDSWTEIQQNSSNIDLKVSKDGIVNAINMSPETTSIFGKKLFITAETYIADAIIKNSMIDNINAEKITAGTLNAAKINVINLNATSITTGTLSGSNLSLNLNTGVVTFQRGRIHNASNSIDINIDAGYMSVANGSNRAMLKNGEMQFVEPGTYDTSNNPYLRISNTFGGQSTEGAAFIGRKYAALTNSDNLTGSGIFDIGMGTETFSGIATGYGSGFLNKGWHMTKVGGAERGVVISGGKSTSYNPSWSASPSIMVGATKTNNSSGGMHGSNIIMECDYLFNYSTWRQTTSHAANVYVSDDGAIVRASSASKYKTNIERSFDTKMGERILEVPTAHWFDKAEVLKKTLDPQAPNPRRYFGMVADDLDDAGLTELVEYNEKGEVEGLMYDRVALTLIPIVRNYRDRITKLESEIKQLKEG
ncbi:Chromosome partition protein Smc [Lactiplantibacillus plantarum]|uniref:phage tail protein n=1 Tax=Lactiplantibacillus plantarum TaxID=1590 RepID=UPI0013672A8C|nr:phage tail protein [Lactiplantibacillus plantarum]QHM61147.1 Chromosome partition protein Smc [Lactiplantibacillus plantarum]